MSADNNGFDSLVGSVFERKPAPSKASSPSQSRFSTALNSKTGFPPVQHRSLKSSAFLKNRDDSRRKQELSSERTAQVPSIATAGPGPKTMENQSNTMPANDWRTQIGAENEAKVQAMTEEEREAERREILERFGPSVGEILRRAREKREAKKDTKPTSLEEVPVTSEREPPTAPATPLISSLSRSPSRSSTRPNSPSRASRKLRFAELAPDQVHVYPSAPSSPKKQALLLPPPDPEGDAVSLGTFNGYVPTAPSIGASKAGEEEFEEGTPEYIRKKYFPSAPAENPDLAWLSSSPTSSFSQDQNLDLRFDLTGTPIPSSKALSLPTHLGLHHHAEGNRAGYTIDDIFLLTRSTVRAQRAVMLDVLVGVVRWLRVARADEDPEIEAARKSLLSPTDSQPSQTPLLLKRILFAGLEALPERGVVGVRAMDVVWECVVGQQDASNFQDDLESELGGMEEERADYPDLITALPLADVLPQLLNLLLSPPDSDGNNLGDNRSSSSFTAAESKSHSLRTTPTQQQILSVLTRIARYSNVYAETIVKERALVEGLLKVFIIPPSTTFDHLTPDTSAICLLSILASASRTNAEALCEKIVASDALLRFVVLSTNDSTLIEIMLFYTILARYGMYSRVAADAQEVWWKIGDHVADLSSSYSRPNSRFIRVYAGLIESWFVCATDPHRTTPSHELRWSQVKGWEWGASLTSLLVKFSQVWKHNEDNSNAIEFDLDYLSTAASLWRSLGAYLEGAKVNGIRGGEEERTEVCLVLKRVFDSSTSQMLGGLVKNLARKLSTTKLGTKKIASGTMAVLSVIRLWLGCCPPDSMEDSPPFELPFSAISDLCANLVAHDLWNEKSLHPLFLRPLTTLLAFFLRLSPRLPNSHPDLWLAQAFSVVHTLQRGDEEYALHILPQILGALTSDWAAQRGGVGAPHAVWEEKGGLKGVLGPFLSYEVNPERDTYTYISPLCPSPRSIGMSTTLRIPSSTLTRTSTEWHPVGLPLHSDWTLSPINHLLRSGSEYSIFKQPGVLPDTWDASETDVVRATLALARAEREVLSRFASSVMTVIGAQREGITFACMKVFMLEHGVGTGNSKAASEGERSLQEVFRDTIVARQMRELLEPYTAKAHSRTVPPAFSSSLSSAPLELAAFSLLGTSVPFYQFYTDFLSLYDSISFSHPLFSRLLLPPTSMLYAADYRKLLWNDYSHTLRGIRVEVGDVIAGKGGIEEWMYPVETDPEILGAYLGALVKYGSALQGFLRLLAVHHVAASIWPDFRTDSQVEEDGIHDERRSRLLKASIEQAGPDVVREVLRYRQSPPSHDISLPPKCFERVDETCKQRRCELIEKWGGRDVLERVKGVFDE